MSESDQCQAEQNSPLDDEEKGRFRSEEMNLLDLPDECLEMILENIRTQELIQKVRRVCWRLRAVVDLICQRKRSIIIHIRQYSPAALEEYLFLSFKASIADTFYLEPAIDESYYSYYFSPEEEFKSNQFFDEYVHSFVAMFPGLTSLTIQAPHIPHLAGINRLIESYPSLKRLEVEGDFLTVDVLRKLTKLKHFIFKSHQRPFEWDRVFMRAVPEVFQQLETLQMHTWRDPKGLPENLKAIAFRECPQQLWQDPEHYAKFAGYKHWFKHPDDGDTISTTIELLPRHSNIQVIDLFFEIDLNAPSFLIRFFKALQHLPKLTTVILNRHVWAYENEADPEISRYIANCRPLGNLKYVEIHSCHFPVREDSLRSLFPNADIYCREKFVFTDEGFLGLLRRNFIREHSRRPLQLGAKF